MAKRGAGCFKGALAGVIEYELWRERRGSEREVLLLVERATAVMGI